MHHAPFAKSRPRPRLRPLRAIGRSSALALGLVVAALAPLARAQVTHTAQKVGGCTPKTAIEFIAPMPTEEVPVFHGPSPNPDSFHVLLEIAVEQAPGQTTGVLEGSFVPSPGAAAAPPTDVNADGVLGDPHPAIPGLTLTMDDDLYCNGTRLPAGTNLASLFEILGSEIEHGGDQSTSVSWILDPFQYFVLDLNGDLGTNLVATINGVSDTIFFRHGWDPLFQTQYTNETPTLSIWTTDWISTVDSSVPPDQATPFLVGVEVRIPCFFDTSTSPPTPVPLDPIFGPCQGGTMACTGNFGPQPGPGFHPMFPSLDVRFSDDYIDGRGTFVQGGTISGGACGTLWHATGQNLAYAFQQASVSAWYGVNGVPDTTPLGGGDDQLIYRFVLLADGFILDTDALPNEMLISAAVETMSNCFSITNCRVKHRPDVTTPDPGP